MFPRKVVILMAADHGVALEGISAYPSTVTAQMVSRTLPTRGAAVNVLARQNNARVVVVDIGVTQESRCPSRRGASQPGKGQPKYAPRSCH